MTQEHQSTATPISADPSSALSVFDRALEEARANLEATAQQIKVGSFSADGVGYVGTLFRSLRDQEDPILAREQWAHLLSLASELWQEEYRKDSVQLLKDAQVRLSPPVEFQDHFKESIAYGEDYIVFLRAKERFDEGETEEAKELLAGLDKEIRAPLEEQIDQLGERRRKSRKKALTIAGTMGVALTAACIYSVISLADFLRDPPTLPSGTFDFSRAMPDIEFPEATETVSVTDGELDLPGNGEPSPEIYRPDLAGESVIRAVDTEGEQGSENPDFRIEDVFGPEGGGSQDQISDIETSSEDPATAQAPDTPVAPPAEAPQTSQGSNSAQAADQEAALLERCALAFRISAAATRDAVGDRQTRLAREFQNKFLAACSDLPFDIQTLEDRAETIDDTQVIEMTRNVLETE